MKERLLIFDFDGVILDSLPPFRAIFNQLASKYDIEEIESDYALGKLFRTNFFDGVINYGLKENCVDDFLIDCRHKTFENLGKYKVFDGIQEALKKISENNIMTIASSNHDDVVNHFIDNNYLREYFDLVYGSSKYKSKVDKINKFVEKFGINKEQTYYIGDTVGDIIEGKKAGVKTVGVCWGYHAAEEFEISHPDYLLEEIDELVKLFM